MDSRFVLLNKSLPEVHGLRPGVVCYLYTLEQSFELLRGSGQTVVGVIRSSGGIIANPWVAALAVRAAEFCIL